MPNLIIPTIGLTGYYPLSAPFDGHVIENEKYTCHAIRRIGDYVALNEDIKAIVYDFYGLTNEDFENDRKDNMYILSLQSESGEWLYVPARFLLSYPIVNGVGYRSTALSLSLGAIPEDFDLEPIKTMISDIVFDTLGIRPNIAQVITSKTILVSSENHASIEAARLIRATSKRSFFSLYKDTQIQLTKCLTKIQELELYIKNHFNI